MHLFAGSLNFFDFGVFRQNGRAFPTSVFGEDTMPKFIPRERKHKVRQRNEKNGSVSKNDSATTESNAVEILPSSTTDKDSKKQRIRAELRAQQPKISAQKQKRLDKYIVRRIPHGSLEACSITNVIIRIKSYKKKKILISSRSWQTRKSTLLCCKAPEV